MYTEDRNRNYLINWEAIAINEKKANIEIKIEFLDPKEYVGLQNEILEVYFPKEYTMIT